VAIHPEDVVEAPRNLAVARMLNGVLPDLVFERLDVVIDVSAESSFTSFLKSGRSRCRVNLLEGRVQEAVERNDRPVRRFQVVSRTLLALASLRASCRR